MAKIIIINNQYRKERKYRKRKEKENIENNENNENNEMAKISIIITNNRKENIERKWKENIEK